MAKTKRQSEIPGTERHKIAEVNTAAEAYVEARDARMKKTESEVETRDALIAVMEKHKLTTYRDDDAAPPLVITVTPGQAKVKVRREDEEDEGGDDE